LAAGKSIFSTHILDLIQNNYYRGIGENGKFIDSFWLDFTVCDPVRLRIFCLVVSISRRHAGLTWLEGMLRRWYDIFLLLPFWRWLQWCDDSPLPKFMNLEPVRAQIKRDFVANFAEELTEIVGIRLIDRFRNQFSEAM